MTNRKRVATIRLTDQVSHFELYLSPAAFVLNLESRSPREEFIDLNVVKSDGRVVHRK